MTVAHHLIKGTESVSFLADYSLSSASHDVSTDSLCVTKIYLELGDNCVININNTTAIARDLSREIARKNSFVVNILCARKLHILCVVLW